MPPTDEPEDLQVFEGEEASEDEAFVTYDIASYPSDVTLSVINEMWKQGDLIIPEFQRHFVWSMKQSSLLIESFLIGLPVPQAFIYVDEDNRNLVIDGQQRILSVIYFFEGYFGPENLKGRRQVFRLTGLNEKSPFHKKRFEDLEDSDQRKLKGAVLRLMNVKQLSPQNDKTSVYYIFERLNTGGTPLKPQEIRNCVYRGPLVGVLSELNKLTAWRNILGKKNLDKHQKDVELILRIMALHSRWKHYEKPMKEFLNLAMERERNVASEEIKNFISAFPRVTSHVNKFLGDKPFHVRGPLNSSVLDSVMSVLIATKKELPTNLESRFEKLLMDKRFEETTYYGTSDEAILKERFHLAERYLLGSS